MILEVFSLDTEAYKEMMNVIIDAKVNPPKKGQIHHIIPRCWFKHYNMKVDDSISNTVLLTWEDHKKVHELAYKCAKEKWLKSRLAFAHSFFGEKRPELSKECMPMYGKSQSLETRKRISDAQKGERNHMFGKLMSDEQKKKISDALKGEKSPMFGKHLSDSTKQKIRNSNIGKHHTEETKRKIGKYWKGRKRKPFSAEHRRKLSESAKHRKQKL